MKQLIKCPECGSVELGIIDTSTFPWNTLIHNCNSCGYIIMESEWDPLKALSVQQPWAWLIVNGYKPLENRKTLKNLKGTFLIHAGQKVDFDSYEFLAKKVKLDRKTLDKAFSYEVCKKQAGGIVGYAEFNGSVQESDSPWFAGPNGLIIENAKPLEFVPCKGQQGVFYPKIY